MRKVQATLGKFVGSLLLALAPTAWGAPISIVTSGDTNLLQVAPNNTYNYGLSGSLTAENRNPNDKQILMKFSTLSITEPSSLITSVELKFESKASGGAGIFTIHLADDNWSEGNNTGQAGTGDEATWDNMGANYSSTALATFTGVTAGIITIPNTADLLAAVKDAVDTDNVLSLMILQANGSGNLQMYAKEQNGISATTGQPYLDPTLVVSVPEPASLSVLAVAGLLLANRRCRSRD